MLTTKEQHGLLPLTLRRPSAAIREFLSLTQALGLSLQAAWVLVVSSITVLQWITHKEIKNKIPRNEMLTMCQPWWISSTQLDESLSKRALLSLDLGHCKDQSDSFHTHLLCLQRTVSFLHLWAGPDMTLQGKEVPSPVSCLTLDCLFLYKNLRQGVFCHLYNVMSQKD